MGGWRVAQSPILTTTITLKRLEMKGYESLLEFRVKRGGQLGVKYSLSRFYFGIQWCERRTPLVNSGEAVYSIICRFKFSI